MLISNVTRAATALAVLTVSATPLSAAPILIASAVGANQAAIQADVDAFRTVLGDPNNGNVGAPQPGGRREINWDGGGDAALATVFPNPMTVFSNRGAVFTSPGGSTEISGQPMPEFGEINPTYPDIFETFSTPRLFAPLGSNVTDSLFTEPGNTNVPAATQGFGVVFTDVDLADTTSLQLFDLNGNSLGVFYAPTQNNGLSFLGVFFASPVIARARIVTGNSALGPNDDGLIDVVAMDDFLYSEPQVVPEPTSLLLLGSGLSGLVAFARKRRRNAALSAGEAGD